MIQERQILFYQLAAAYRKLFKTSPPLDNMTSLEAAISLLTRAVFTGRPIRIDNRLSGPSF